MFEASLQAFANIFTPMNLGLLFVAVVAGLILGAVPGLGGITGLTLLLPFVFDLPPDTTMILLVGLAAVVNTGDTIPAILMGVPGTSAAQATILDGFSMTKNGEAGRAFGASYTSSILGGLFGAIVLLLTLPVLEPLVLSMGSPELLMVSLLGVSMVGTLTGRVPLIGLALALFGVLLSMIGQDPETAIYRWTFDQLYLFDGLPFIPVALGIFALPELIETVGRGQSLATQGTMAGISRGLFRGIRDTFKNWFLVVRCSLIGVYVGLVPGMGSEVVDWVAYAHAAQTIKDREKLGKGDVRGVIAPEAANNAKVGGALIPTVAFGVPGSMMMVILLGALTMAGITPGPEMVTKHLHITLTMVWTLAIANIMGGILCMFLTSQIAKLSYVRIGLLSAFILVAVFVAAVQATGNLADLIMLLVFGLVGWTLKKLDWPRPPLALGLVLGPVASQYLFISVQRYGFTWLTRPGVIIIGLVLIASLVHAALSSRRDRRSQKEAVA